MSSTGHKSVRKGKRVYVRYKDGTHAVDKFLKRDSGYVHLESAGKVKDRKIDSIGIYRASSHSS